MNASDPRSLPPVRVTKQIKFSAAHRLCYHDGKCSRPHGHTFVLEVTAGAYLQSVEAGKSESGMTLDFGRLGEAMKRLHDLCLDHQDLGDFDEYPTAERLALRIAYLLLLWFEKDRDMWIEQVRLYEEFVFPQCFVTIGGPGQQLGLGVFPKDWYQDTKLCHAQDWQRTSERSDGTIQPKPSMFKPTVKEANIRIETLAFLSMEARPDIIDGKRLRLALIGSSERRSLLIAMLAVATESRGHTTMLVSNDPDRSMTVGGLLYGTALQRQSGGIYSSPMLLVARPVDVLVGLLDSVLKSNVAMLITEDSVSDEEVEALVKYLDPWVAVVPYGRHWKLSGVVEREIGFPHDLGGSLLIPSSQPETPPQSVEGSGRQEKCSYCGEYYPYPVGHHHSEEECQDAMVLRGRGEATESSRGIEATPASGSPAEAVLCKRCNAPLRDIDKAALMCADCVRAITTLPDQEAWRKLGQGQDFEFKTSPPVPTLSDLNAAVALASEPAVPLPAEQAQISPADQMAAVLTDPTIGANVMVGVRESLAAPDLAACDELLGQLGVDPDRDVGVHDEPTPRAGVLIHPDHGPIEVTITNESRGTLSAEGVRKLLDDRARIVTQALEAGTYTEAQAKLVAAMSNDERGLLCGWEEVWVSDGPNPGRSLVAVMLPAVLPIGDGSKFLESVIKMPDRILTTIMEYGVYMLGERPWDFDASALLALFGDEYPTAQIAVFADATSKEPLCSVEPIIGANGLQCYLPIQEYPPGSLCLTIMTSEGKPVRIERAFFSTSPQRPQGEREAARYRLGFRKRLPDIDLRKLHSKWEELSTIDGARKVWVFSEDGTQYKPEKGWSDQPEWCAIDPDIWDAAWLKPLDSTWEEIVAKVGQPELPADYKQRQVVPESVPGGLDEILAKRAREGETFTAQQEEWNIPLVSKDK